MVKVLTHIKAVILALLDCRGVDVTAGEATAIGHALLVARLHRVLVALAVGWCHGAGAEEIRREVIHAYRHRLVEVSTRGRAEDMTNLDESEQEGEPFFQSWDFSHYSYWNLEEII